MTEDHDNLQQAHHETSADLNLLEAERLKLTRSLAENSEELYRVKGDMVFSKQQEIQTRLTRLKSENEEYAQSIKMQQQRILSLQDQLQSSHIASRQYTKTIEELETRTSAAEKEAAETKLVLAEMNAKFVNSQTQLEDQKHKEMILNAKHLKEIQIMAEKQQAEIDKLEMGFQETLRQNERKMQDLQTLRCETHNISLPPSSALSSSLSCMTIE